MPRGKKMPNGGAVFTTFGDGSFNSAEKKRLLSDGPRAMEAIRRARIANERNRVTERYGKIK